MSFLIHLLILFLLPCLSTSSYEYGIIGNASINTLDNVNHNLSIQTCNDCLCYAFENIDKVDLFTCTQKASNVICQFYSSMPTRDQIEYPRNDASIYLMKKNKTFQNNCCNTQHLVQMINKTSAGNFSSGNLRSLIEGDHNTIVTNTFTSVIKFDKSTLQLISEKIFSDITIKSIGYWDNRYYLGTINSIEIYDETLNQYLSRIHIGNDVTTIRFLNGTYMFVGASVLGVLIYEKGVNGDFTNRTSDLAIGAGPQVHAISIVNESAFYVGWDDANVSVILFTKDQTNSWKPSTTDTINRTQTSDIVFDNTCKRIWITEAYKTRIFIYDKDKTSPYNITVSDGLFNFLILNDSNYTLVISSSKGLFRIQPNVNCRSPS